MTGNELSYKLKYILSELGMNKKELLDACRLFNPSLSKPTLLNAINNKNTTLPTIETLKAIIMVCQTSNNKKLQNISFDFLLNDNIQEIEAKTIHLYNEIGLSDDVINRLKQYNHPLYYNYSNIINYYLYHIPFDYFKYLEHLKVTCDIKNEIIKIDYDVKKIIKLLSNDSYMEYIERNFRNIYEMYMNIKKKKEITDKNKIVDLLNILINHYKYLLIEMNKNLYELMEER